MKYLFKIIKLFLRAVKYRYRNDPYEIKYLLSNLNKGDTVLDVGSHKGAYLYYFSKAVGKNGKVIGFEPQQILFNYLKSISEFLGNQVKVENLALSDEVKEMKLYVPSHGKKENTTSPGASLERLGEGTEIVSSQTVNTDTLDNYCERNQLIPDFIKIDVEGHELKLLRGAKKVIEKFKPLLLVEIELRHIGNEKMKETLDFICSLGYHGYFVKGNRKLPLQEFNPQIDQNASNKKDYANNFIFEPE